VRFFASLILIAAFAVWAKSPLDRLDLGHLEAVHAQRVEWMKQRAPRAPLGVFQDFRGVVSKDASFDSSTARAADVRVVLTKNAVENGIRDGVLFLGSVAGEGLPQFPEPSSGSPSWSGNDEGMTPKELRTVEARFKQYPDEVFAVAGAALENSRADHRRAALQEVSLRHENTHILARDLSEGEIRKSLAEGHAYVSHDWLCDPTGFSFVAESNLGVYEIGDTAPIMHTVIRATLPIAAQLKLLRNGTMIAEANNSNFSFEVKEEGDYRLEAWLTVDGETLPWIYSNALHIAGPPNFTMPPAETPANVEVHKDITYTEGDPADAAKHKLDLYLPKNKKTFPVIVFLHGGSWRTGDRAMYGPLGIHFAKLGIGVAIPSYRLMPNHPHPAQIEDAAAAFAWVYKNVGQYGGDVKRISLVGHSAGGHLAALLALDWEYLTKHDVPLGAIRSVAALSGVYEVNGVPGFVSEKGAPDPSPSHVIHSQAPPFLITYCQWDYFGLPKQAREFAAALKKSFVASQLVYIPRQNHLT
jgi:acetyl esterase/lipase